MRALKQIRSRKDLTQHGLAEISGVAQNTISEIETGQRDPRGATLRKLAAALEVEIAELYGEPGASWVPLAVTDPRVENWLEKHGFKFALMEEQEFVERVREADPERVGDVEALISEIQREGKRLKKVINKEWMHGSKLLPKATSKDESFTRHHEMMRLKQETSKLYSAKIVALYNYAGGLPPYAVEEEERERHLDEALANA